MTGVVAACTRNLPPRSPLREGIPRAPVTKPRSEAHTLGRETPLDFLEDTSSEEEAEHTPTLEWIGCPKCDLPINITVRVKDFGYELLAHVYDMLAHADAREAREAIGEILPGLGSEINEATRRNPYFWPLISAGEKAQEAKRREGLAEKPRAGKRAASLIDSPPRLKSRPKE